MQMRVVALSPATELTDLEAVADLCRLAAGATALTDEPLDQLRSFLVVHAIAQPKCLTKSFTGFTIIIAI